ncbi:MAG: hypothetical protein IJ483_05635, partial [Flavobacteriales bacterium]|nr:hypothetical protein [Flavobacteriales bacterium]
MENSQTNVFLTPIEYLKGIGPRRAMTLKNELGIYNAGDLLTFYPFRYVDKSRFYTVSQLRQVQDVDVQVVGRLGRVEEVKQGLKVVRMTATLSDGTGVMQLVWFKGFSWIKRNLKEGENYVVYGRVSIFAGRVSMAHPEMETQLQYEASPMGTLVPMYSSTEKTQKAGITQRLISTAIHSFLEQWDSHIHETLSRDVLKENNLMGRREAIRNIHFPVDNESLSRARYRMKFEELFYMQMAMVRKKIARANRFTGYKFAVVGRLFNEFYAHHLSFELTGAQKRVIKEIRRDVNTGAQMNRLVQANLPIEKRNMNTEDAIALFRELGMTDKEKLFRYRRSSRVNIYVLDHYKDYFYGY